jgi:hypothetical protein
MNRVYFYSNSHKIFFWCFLACFAGQILFWFKTENYHPSAQVMPEAPSQVIASAISFGDKEYLFRILGIRLINSGDVFAGFSPLKNYDYGRIYRWMKTLDNLNSESFVTPYTASFYYSNVQEVEKNREIIKYLDEHASQNPEKKWMFFSFAAMIAKFKLKDMPLAQSLAKKISQIDDKTIPMINLQLYAILSEEMGESCVAYNEMKRINDLVKTGKLDANSSERAFLKFFLEYRAFRMDNGKFNPKKCLHHLRK